MFDYLPTDFDIVLGDRLVSLGFLDYSEKVIRGRTKKENNF